MPEDSPALSQTKTISFRAFLASLMCTRMFLTVMTKKKREIHHLQRRYPIGAELIGPKEAHFRIWAPKVQRLDLVLEEGGLKDSRQSFHELEAEPGGYFSGSANAGAGARYRFRVNNEICIRTQHHVSNLMGHMVLLALSIPRSFGGPIRTGLALS